jgi:hypothetical protein
MALSTAAWDDTGSPNSRKGIDVEYEQLSGDAMFIWGDPTTADRQRYFIWNGSTLSGPTNLDIADMNGNADWIKLYPRPDSDQMMYVVQDTALDLNSAYWNGAAFTVHVGDHDDSVENIQSMSFDFVWETHPTRTGRGWLLWGNGSTVTTQAWNSGTTSFAAAATLANTDDTSMIRMAAQRSSGTVFAGIYESTASAGALEDDIYDTHQTAGGGAWSAVNMLWDGGTVANPVHFRIDIAPERYTPIVSWTEVLP